MKTKQSTGICISLLRKKTNEILVGVAILIFTFGNAQSAAAQFKQGIQLKSGAATQSELFDIYANSDLKYAYGFGWVGEYRFNERFALQSGVELIEKGAGRTIDDSRISERCNYLQLPLRAKYIAGEKAGLKNGKQFYVAAGPYVSYLLLAKSHSSSRSYSITDSANLVDAGLSFGCGFEFPLAKTNHIQLGLDYDMGMTEVYKSNSGVNNKMVSLSVGLLF